MPHSGAAGLISERPPIPCPGRKARGTPRAHVPLPWKGVPSGQDSLGVTHTIRVGRSARGPRCRGRAGLGRFERPGLRGLGRRARRQYHHHIYYIHIHHHRRYPPGAGLRPFLRGPDPPGPDGLPGAGAHRRGRPPRHPAAGRALRLRPRRPAERLRPARPAGPGQTVAIVDAYDDPNAESDLATYRSQYGLPACTTANGCFKKVEPERRHQLPDRRTPAGPGRSRSTSTWSRRSARTATSCWSRRPRPSIDDLGTAVNSAVSAGRQVRLQQLRRRRGLQPTPASDAAYFNHPGVGITASSGDGGYGVGVPGGVAVRDRGRRHLADQRRRSARGWTETVWDTSATERRRLGLLGVRRRSRPGRTTPAARKRTVADVSAVADPNTGVAVYDTYGGGGWTRLRRHQRVLADHRRDVRAGRRAGAPAPPRRPYPYAHTGNLNDVTSGSNGTLQRRPTSARPAPATTARPASAPRTAPRPSPRRLAAPATP